MKISVVIPIYNAEKFLHRCLDSVINQTYPDWEVLAIDDGSKDNSYSILLDYASHDGRFTVSSHVNRGSGYTRNFAIRLATGDYIVFLDADDYLDVEYFKDLAACVEANNPDVVFVDIRREKPDGSLLKYELMSRYKRCPKDTVIRHQMTGKLPWGGCRKAVKTSILIDNGIRYSEDTVGEEALYSFRVLLAANSISFIDKPYYHYVNYPNSLSSKGEDNPWGNVCKNIEEYLKNKRLIDKYGAALNSLNYTASIISIYRIAKNNRLKETLQKSKIVLRNFRQNYGYHLDLGSLEVRVLLLLPFAWLNMTLIIVLTAKLKNKLG